jgi:trk system potassium uptake protein TrkH
MHATTSGVLLASIGVPFIVARASFGPFLSGPPWVMPTAVSLSVLLFVAGLIIPSRPAPGRVAASLSILGTLGLGSLYFAGAPFVTLAVLLAATASLALLWKVGSSLVGSLRPHGRPLHEGRAQGAAIAAVVLWSLRVLPDSDRSDTEWLAVAGAELIAALLALTWSFRERGRNRRRTRAVLVACGASGTIALAFWGDWWIVSSGLAGAALCFSFVIRAEQHPQVEQAGWWEPLLGHPERLFVGTFAALCGLGTVLLALPQSASSGQSIGLIDAVFTATSAVCVTGLIVLDTPVDFSLLGQVVVLLLIQVGGLGIMTFSTAALWALGQRMSLRHEGAVASLISTKDRGRLFATAKRILLLTGVAEGAGAVCLFAMFLYHGDAITTAAWRGVFTSVSAFCNAGFALQSDSLIPYQSSAVVLHVVAALIVLGGLSPLAVFSIPALARHSNRPVPAQAKLSLAAAGLLLVLGFCFVLAFEWNQSLGNLPFFDRLHNAWFQSVTLRTAGFNSIDVAVVRPATLSLMMIWMFIGGSPGSTAGGIKTTTASVLVLSVVHVVQGKWTFEAFGRRISERTRAKAAVVVSLAAATAAIALVVIQLTQEIPARSALFEVISALGTVGLSVGATSQLDAIGKLIITGCMFVGRVGGLTFLMFLRTRRQPKSIGRPEEEIDVG